MTHEFKTRGLIVATLALCCLAPVITALSLPADTPLQWSNIFLRLFAFNDHAASLAILAAMVLTLASPPIQRATIAAAAWIGEHPAFAIAISFAVLVLCSRFVYLAHPLSMDEYAPWLQAHAFARGDLAAHYPPALLDSIVPPNFQGVFISVDHASGAAVSKYWPGLALVMTPFVWLNMTWCVNPAFAALALTVIYRLVVDATGNRAAGGWAILIALASPQFTVNAISYYAMPGELALNLLFLWLLLKPDLKGAFAAGLVGGLSAIMHNPVPHGLMAAPCLLWLALDKQRWPRLLAVAGGYLPLIAIALGWSSYISALDAGHSSTLASPLSVVTRMAAFVNSFLMVPDLDLLTARWYATWKLWIWTCPGLLLLLFVARGSDRTREITARLLLAGFVTTFVFYLFVIYDQGHGWGYRYLHGAWAALPVIAGLWLAAAPDTARRFAGAMVAAGVLATPVFMWQTQTTVQEAVSWRLSPPSPGDWVIFVAQNTGLYRGDLVQNAPGRTDLLYLVSNGRDKDRTLVERHFPAATLVLEDRRGSAWRLE